MLPEQSLDIVVDMRTTVVTKTNAGGNFGDSSFLESSRSSGGWHWSDSPERQNYDRKYQKPGSWPCSAEARGRATGYLSGVIFPTYQDFSTPREDFGEHP
jgi:hypothetical protein